MGAKLAPRRGYVGQLGAQSGQLGAILGAILAHLGHLGANLKENGEKTKNIEKPQVFLGFWVVWGVFLEPCGDHVGLCWRILATRWAMLGHLGAMLRHLGDKMRPKSAKLSQDGAQERQEEPYEAPRWPTWRQDGAKMANMRRKMANLTPFGGASGRLFGDLGRDL